MAKLWNLAGRMAYIFGLPVLYLLLRNTHRSRVLVVAEDKVLLVKTWIGNGKWTVPGGGLHADEDAKSAAIREVFEETGLTITKEQLAPLGEFPYGGAWFRFTCHGFIVEAKQAHVPQKQFPEINDIAWLPLADISQQQVGADVRHLLETWQKRG